MASYGRTELISQEKCEIITLSPFSSVQFSSFHLVSPKDPWRILTWKKVRRLVLAPSSSSLTPTGPLSTHLPSNGLIVDEVTEVQGGAPGVIQIIDAGAAGLPLLPLGHGQLVPAGGLD